MRSTKLAMIAVALAIGRPAHADDSCSSALDGACGELIDCRLGSDTTDCMQACEGDWPAQIAGACAHYSAASVGIDPVVEEEGTQGFGGRTGLWSATSTAAGETRGSSIVRHYLVYVPETYDPSRPTPLLFMLAGFTVDMYGLPAYTELMRTASANGFIVVFPQQHYRWFGPQIGWVFAWHVYAAEWEGGDWSVNPDVDFIRRLTAEMKRLYNIDPKRVYASGHSRGAGMSIVLAFELPDLIAGFLSESGFVEPNGYSARISAYAGERRIPGVLIHGSEDPDVPVESSDLIRDTLVSAGWIEGEDFLYLRLANVAHEWQPQYNQYAWDFLESHPLPRATETP